MVCLGFKYQYVNLGQISLPNIVASYIFHSLHSSWIGRSSSNTLLYIVMPNSLHTKYRCIYTSMFLSKWSWSVMMNAVRELEEKAMSCKTHSMKKSVEKLTNIVALQHPFLTSGEYCNHWTLFLTPWDALESHFQEYCVLVLFSGENFGIKKIVKNWEATKIF